MESKENRIEKVMKGAMSSLKEIVDGDTVIGSPYTVADGTVLIPVSKVTLAYVAGGGEYSTGDSVLDTYKSSLPLSAGSGGYVSLTPLGVISCKGEKVSAVPLEKEESAFERIATTLIENLSKAVDK